MVGFQRKASGGDRPLGRSSGSCEPEDRGGGIFFKNIIALFFHICKIFTIGYDNLLIPMVSFCSGQLEIIFFFFFLIAWDAMTTICFLQL